MIPNAFYALLQLHFFQHTICAKGIGSNFTNALRYGIRGSFLSRRVSDQLALILIEQNTIHRGIALIFDCYVNYGQIFRIKSSIWIDTRNFRRDLNRRQTVAPTKGTFPNLFQSVREHKVL